jgi:hypothetical protein
LGVSERRACKELGIEGLYLYGGTRRTTTTELATVAGREADQEANEDTTNKAFERYCQVQGERAHAMANLLRKHQTGDLVKLHHGRTTKSEGLK